MIDEFKYKYFSCDREGYYTKWEKFIRKWLSWFVKWIPQPRYYSKDSEYMKIHIAITGDEAPIRRKHD